MNTTYQHLGLDERAHIQFLLERGLTIREKDWIDDWDPVLVISASGLAEPDCVFVTRAALGDVTWYIARHDADAGQIEMLKITPKLTACRLEIRLRAVGEGTEATITYTHTSLGPEGDSFIKTFTEDFYRKFMQDWEARMNRYLATQGEST